MSWLNAVSSLVMQPAAAADPEPARLSSHSPPDEEEEENLCSGREGDIWANSRVDNWAKLGNFFDRVDIWANARWSFG